MNRAFHCKVDLRSSINEELPGLVLSARVFNDWQTDQGDLTGIISVLTYKSVGFFLLLIF